VPQIDHRRQQRGRRHPRGAQREERAPRPVRSSTSGW
jgi:hypothetical protein